MHVANDYMLLSQRFASVRRAWKRNAALGGLAIVVTEGIGLFTVLIFLDWLYQPQPMVRLAFAALTLIAIGWLVARHVVKPLLRKIPDEQIALYIEEHRTGLEGVLITAAEFSKKRDGVSERQAALIDAVIAQASQRSAKMQINAIADFSRLKKYGIVALAGICAYILLGALFPGTFGHHFGRVLVPWQATEEDIARHDAAAAAAEPLRFTLSKGDSSLARGSSFDFQATLSKAKAAGTPVMLNFRSKDGGDWKQLPMTEIEKLNGFQGSLPDITEDLDFYVSCGTDKSDTFHLTVYDPLVVQSLETTVHYPDYLKLPDEVTRPSTGDVTAVVGSTVMLRVLTSTTLKDGQIKWADGHTQPMTVDPQATATATVSFPVQQDGSYDFTVSDVNGQQAVSPASLTVHAIPDTPPTISLKSPQSPVLTNPLGEIHFDVEAGDDFGVAGVDLVYARVDAQGKSVETRLALKLAPTDAKDMQNAVEGTYLLALEDMNPPVQPNDAISFHLEARDAKGQKVSSPLGFIIINAFENWGTWGTPGSEKGVHDDTGADLMAVVALIWDVNNAKGQTNPTDWKKQVDTVAGKMVNAQGQMLDFSNLNEMPQLTKIAPLMAQHIKKAHDALVQYDSETATTEISIAGALFSGNGILLNSQLRQGSQETVVGSHYHAPAMTMLEQARMAALADATKDKSKQEGEAGQAKAAADAAQKVADLINKQDQLVAKAQAQAAGASKDSASGKGGAGSAGSAGDAKQSPATQSQSGQANAAQLAAQQHDLAEQTRKAAEAARSNAADNTTLQASADKTAAAARLMEEASRAFAAGNNAAGQDKAQQAKGALQDAGNSLQTLDKDKLEAAISAAQAHASLLLDKLKDLNTQTSALAKDLGSKQPDQRQQRDLQKQAYQQTQLAAEDEALNTEIATLDQWAQQIGQPESMRALDDAQRVVRRSQPQAKLSGAAVDLNNANPTSADAEQKNAADALQKIVDNLNAGSDSLAASRDAQLRRAQRAAQQAKQDLAALQGKSASAAADKSGAGAQAQANAKGDAAGAQGANGGKGAQAQANAKGDAAGAQGANGGKGAQAQANAKGGAAGAAGAQGGQGAQAQANAKGGAAGAQAQQDGAGAKAQAGQNAGAQAQDGTTTSGAQAMSGGGGDPDTARRLAYNLTQLAAVIDNRQLVPQDQVDQLKQMGEDKDALAKKLETDPKFLQDMTQIVGTIDDKIEAELEAKAQAGKLFSSQREECPPNYRQFVNQYFEALSHIAPAPANAATPPAQP